MSYIARINVTIPAGASMSSAFTIGTGRHFLGIVVPAGFEGSPAVLSFQSAPDGVTFRNIYDDGGYELAITVVANTVVGVGSGSALNELAHLTTGKMRSGTSAGAIIQAADRVLTVLMRDDTRSA